MVAEGELKWYCTIRSCRTGPSSLERRPKSRHQKPLKQRQIWAIRFFLDRERRMRDRAPLDLAIDSKLRGCDLVKIKIGTLVTGQEIRARARVVQQAKSCFFSSNSIAPIGRSRLSTRD